jgi:hypothetical protein
MAHLSIASVQKIGLEAAHEIIDKNITDVEAATAQDSSDQPAYFITFRFDRDRDRARAALLRTRLTQKIRDRLLEEGDARYPIIRLLSDDEWKRHRNDRSR